LQEKKDKRDIAILAAQSDLKSQSKLFAAASAKLKKDPENPDFQEAHKDIEAALAKTKEMIAEDPQAGWDAARAAGIEKA